jgi:predicted nucleotidyltransferase
MSLKVRPHSSVKGEKMVAGQEVKQTIRNIVDKLKNEYKPDKIILFGSYAYGHPDRDSDIDMCIIKETKDRPIDRRVTVAKIVSDPKRLIPFEPLVLSPQEVKERLRAGDQFVQKILERGRVLYEAPTAPPIGAREVKPPCKER